MTHSGTYRHILNRMGYYGYQEGLIYRHLNQDGRWNGHLEKCREYILNAVDRFSPSSVTILGSGWLLDIPISELIERGVKVNLVDIVHPPDVKRQAGDKKNIRLIEADVTGGLIEMVWEMVKEQPFFRKLKSISALTIPAYDPGFDTGLVVSLNILSQLDFLLVNFLRKKARIPAGEIETFREVIQESHLSFLQQRPSVLISDIEEIFLDLENKSKTIPTVLANIPSGNNMEEWTWDFDMKRSDYYTSRSMLKIKALTYGKV